MQNNFNESEDFKKKDLNRASSSSKPKVIVIGLDGTHFEILDSWIKDGRLPNLRKIKEGGVWADMEVCLPPVTSPNWKCYSTGKNPGKIGLFWWENIDCKNKKVDYCPISRKFENKEIWDYIGEVGKKVCVIGMPTTYPPHEVNGIMVSGGPDAQELGFVYPKELEKKLKGKYNYKIHPNFSFEANANEATEEVYKLIDVEFKVAKDLIKSENPDFVQITIFYINVLQHYFWNDEHTKKAWEIIDRNLGWFLNKQYNIVIMADHGSNKIKHVFNINSWLEREGYLRLSIKFKFIKLMYKLRINRQSISRFFVRIHPQIYVFAKKLIPRKIAGNIPREDGVINYEHKTNIIDWKRTKALASGQGPIYLNLDEDTGEYEKVRKRLIRKLESIREPKTGDMIINRVYKKEEIYSGKYLDDAPDIVIDQAKGVHIPGGIGNENVFEFPQKWAAENKKVAAFMAFGPDFKRKKKLEKISILDLAPTILYMMECSIPKDMDGRVLKEIFRENGDIFNKVFDKEKINERKKIKEKMDILRNIGRI